MKGNRFRVCVSLLLGMSCLVSFSALAGDPTQSDQAKQVIAFVDKAAALLAGKGKAAFPEFKVQGGEWLRGDDYIFVYDMKGTPLMHPIYPHLEGINLIDLKDIHMKAFVQRLVEIANTKGSGWFDFMLPRPGQTMPAQKYAYVKTVKIPEGETVIVGSGFWVK